jgi:hypothetical protein
MLVLSMSFFSSCGDDEKAKEDLVGTWNLQSTRSADMTWESSEGVSIGEGNALPTGIVAEMAAQLGSEKLPENLKSITFKSNGKLEANYKDGETGEWITAVYGDYTVISDDKLNFRPDVDKLLSGVEGIDSETMILIKAYAKMGISVYYTLNEDKTTARFYLNTATIKEMKQVFPALAGSVSDEGSAENAMIKAILESLPGILDKTEKIEVGLNFNKMD